MPKRNRLVSEAEDLFRYISTQCLTTLGVPTNRQSIEDEKLLIEIHTVTRDHKTGTLRYTGLLSWISVSQIIVIEEVSNDA